MATSSAQGILAALPNSCVDQGRIVMACSFRFGSALIFGSLFNETDERLALGRRLLMAIPAPMIVMPRFWQHFRNIGGRLSDGTVEVGDFSASDIPNWFTETWFSS
jgi:hypothetical protein